MSGVGGGGCNIRGRALYRFSRGAQKPIPRVSRLDSESCYKNDACMEGPT